MFGQSVSDVKTKNHPDTQRWSENLLSFTSIMNFTFNIWASDVLRKPNMWLNREAGSDLLWSQPHQTFGEATRYLYLYKLSSSIQRQQSVNVGEQAPAVLQLCSGLTSVPGHDERENQHLQHPHQQLSRELEVLHLLSAKEEKKGGNLGKIVGLWKGIKNADEQKMTVVRRSGLKD